MAVDIPTGLCYRISLIWHDLGLPPDSRKVVPTAMFASPTSSRLFSSSHLTLTALALAALPLVGCGDSPVGPSASASSIQLSLSPSTLPVQGGEVELTAKVTSDGSKGVENIAVVFTASAGVLNPATPVLTNSSGEAKAKLTTTSPAVVSAAVATLAGPSSVNGQVNVGVKTPVEITVTPSRADIVIDEAITYDITMRRGGADASGSLTVDFGDGTVRQVGNVSGRASVTHTYTQEGSRELKATLQESDNSRSTYTMKVEVGAASGDQINLKNAIILGPNATDIATWEVTAAITSVTTGPKEICVWHTKTGQWPLIPFDNTGVMLEGVYWIFAQFNGQWYGAVYDYYKPNQACKGTGAEEFGRDQIRVPPMDAGWVPRSGDVVGIMASAPARFGYRSVRERSNVVLYRWP